MFMITPAPPSYTFFILYIFSQNEIPFFIIYFFKMMLKHAFWLQNIFLYDYDVSTTGM